MRFQRSKQYERCVRGRGWLCLGDKPAPSLIILMLIGLFCRQTNCALLHYTGFRPLKGLDVTRYLVPLSGAQQKVCQTRHILTHI